MPEDNTTPAATPVKAAQRKAMAPAGRTAEGADDDRGSWLNRSLQGVSVDDLQTLRRRIDAELRRKAATPEEPSFGLSEGTRVELEQNGTATSPFTGRTLGKDGEPVAVDDENR